MELRPYTSEDAPACLALLDTNTPKFFLPHERVDFAAYLLDLPGPYLVLIDAGAMVACGGYARSRTGPEAVLCWGMVQQNRQRGGLGRVLLLARAQAIAADPSYPAVRLDTTQHSAGFFTRHGFETTKITPDAYGPGVHKHDMCLTLTDDTRARLRARWEALDILEPAQSV